MKAFTELYHTLNRDTDASIYENALVQYFKTQSEEDSIWAIALLANHKPSRLVTTKQLKSWVKDITGFPEFLLDESYKAVGDITETIGLIMPLSKSESWTISHWIRQIDNNKKGSPSQIKEFFFTTLSSLDFSERTIFTKISTGNFRIDLSISILSKALSIVLNQDATKIASRLSSDWSPYKVTYQELLVDFDWSGVTSNPIPFNPIKEMDLPSDLITNPKLWLAEYHWEGIRAQIIKRNNQLFIWSDYEELITHKFPEFKILQTYNDSDFVIEGTLVVFKNDKVLAKQEITKRTKVSKVSKKSLLESPVVFFASDLLEQNNQATTQKSVKVRRKDLAILVKNISIQIFDIIFLSDTLTWNSWSELNILRQSARTINSSGVLLRPASNLVEMREHGTSALLWKVDPYRIIAVLIYAQRGQGRLSNQYSELTFAVTAKDKSLVPVTKCINNLGEEEHKELASFIKSNTVEKFGPVRSLNPSLIFEISASNIVNSKRHKSGLILQSPIVNFWNKELTIEDIDSLEKLKGLIQA